MNRSTKFWVFHRLLFYALVFTCSIILLASVSITVSFPVLVPISNGTSGLGDFGSTDPRKSIQALQFSGFLQDATQVVGIEPSCEDDNCFSYFLPGGLNSINTTCSRITQGIQELDGLCDTIGLTGGMQLDLLAGLFGPAAPNSSTPSLHSPPSENLNNSRTNLSSAFGGGPKNQSTSLKGLQRRQSDFLPGNYTAGLNQAISNSVNWTSFLANSSATRNIPMDELAYLTYNAKGYVLDFSPFSGPWPNYNRICSSYTAVATLNVSLIVCIATESQGLIQSTVVAGLQTCDNTGILGVPCSQIGPEPQYTTRMRLGTAYATTAYSISNATILSFSNMSSSVDYPINMQWFFDSLVSPFEQTKLLDLLQLGSGQPVPDITPLVVLGLLGNFAFGGQGPTDPYHQLRSMMANAISSASLNQSDWANSQPQAASKFIYTVQLAPATLYIFIAFGSLVLLWCLLVMVWSGAHVMANTSGFPEVDFASKWVATSATHGLSNAPSTGVINKLSGNMDIYMGEGVKEGGDGTLEKEATVVLDTVPTGALRKRVKYI